MDGAVLAELLAGVSLSGACSESRRSVNPGIVSSCPISHLLDDERVLLPPPDAATGGAAECEAPAVFLANTRVADSLMTLVVLAGGIAGVV